MLGVCRGGFAVAGRSPEDSWDLDLDFVQKVARPTDWRDVMSNEIAQILDNWTERNSTLVCAGLCLPVSALLDGVVVFQTLFSGSALPLSCNYDWNGNLLKGGFNSESQHGC